MKRYKEVTNLIDKIVQNVTNRVNKRVHISQAGYTKQYKTSQTEQKKLDRQSITGSTEQYKESQTG